jgi:quinol-cytochrome oxidoreductase complex cytochrome b subunit/mono/diheme cytochrome c family protein
VFAKLLDWLDHRTGCRRVMRVLLIEHIPGGAKWRYVWGSCLAFVFIVQLITGLLLMTAYSPGESTAWGSVYFIQYQMDFGWFVRGLHHFGSQTMVVLLGIHMLQVVIAGAQLPPREVNWWLGLLLMAVVLALSLTGYLLPWDQKGYYATQVATNIAGNLPAVGPFLQKVIIGGPEYGNATLTRFYTMHVGILPPLMVVLIIAHLVVFRRHGVTTPPGAQGEGWFWPDQAFKDMVVSMIIFGVLLGMVVWGGHGNPIPQSAAAEKAGEPSLYERWAHAGRDGCGANLDAPADPLTREYPARPEWYFLFLFQLLKYFPGDQELLGTVIIPQAVGLLLFLLPLLGYGRMRKFGHVVGVLVVTAFLTAAAALTFLAVAADMKDPVPRWLMTKIGTVFVPAFAVLVLCLLGLLALLHHGPVRRFISVAGGMLVAVFLLACGLVTFATLTNQLPSAVVQLAEDQMAPAEREISKDVQRFQGQRDRADEAARRAIFLADAGISEQGAKYLMRNDPLTQGPGLFKKHCASCHTHAALPADSRAHPTASDLTGFGSRQWILGLLNEPDSPEYFGRTRFKGGTMSNWVHKTRENPKGGKDNLEQDFRLIADWLGTHPPRVPDDKDPSDLVKGYRAFESKCIRCHTFQGNGGDSETSKGPDFTGYGGVDWLRLMVMSPDSPLRYGRGNRNEMPLFRDTEGPAGKAVKDEVARVKDLLLFQAKVKIAEAKQMPVEEIDENDPKLKAEKAKLEKHLRLVPLDPAQRELIIRWLAGDYPKAKEE